ncbi:helix-turn-helix domain-containing protein [Mongoliitalea daihaiensis]|uniref:helix-turn-helix domain-containing protein n=1 Tax=Mongoliitalea daihaiensis TaxID=2782006 RepID=UPI001F461046|nr:helix-turn-helix transcriptional regulator [Mongoliitalea daihaiensis]UJP66606.1 helix-turn-helix domain-containing protein [Mongoliitalea daihaiensis]
MEEIKIKNMVCPRCIMAVENIVKGMNLAVQEVRLGKLVLKNELTPAQAKNLETSLKTIGFEILKSKEAITIEEIKRFLNALVQEGTVPAGFNLTEVIQARQLEDYSKLSNLFSSMEGQTIERYLIQLKIDKVKEWLFYGEYQLSEMAWKLGYSSVQHLSSQFKKVTGMTPSAFKKIL